MIILALDAVSSFAQIAFESLRSANAKIVINVADFDFFLPT
jgi:hypothetical protein